MNTKILGILLGFVVLGIAMTGGAAAADSTNVNELGTQDCPNCHQDITSTFAELDTQGCPQCHQKLEVTPFEKCCCCNNWAIGTVKNLEADTRSVSETPFDCCCCPMELGVAPSDEARIAFVAGVEA